MLSLLLNRCDLSMESRDELSITGYCARNHSKSCWGLHSLHSRDRRSGFLTGLSWLLTAFSCTEVDVLDFLVSLAENIAAITDTAIFTTEFGGSVLLAQYSWKTTCALMSTYQKSILFLASGFVAITDAASSNVIFSSLLRDILRTQVNVPEFILCLAEGYASITDAQDFLPLATLYTFRAQREDGGQEVIDMVRLHSCCPIGSICSVSPIFTESWMQWDSFKRTSRRWWTRDCAQGESFNRTLSLWFLVNDKAWSIIDDVKRFLPRLAVDREEVKRMAITDRVNLSFFLLLGFRILMKCKRFLKTSGDSGSMHWWCWWRGDDRVLKYCQDEWQSISVLVSPVGTLRSWLPLQGWPTSFGTAKSDLHSHAGSGWCE